MDALTLCLSTLTDGMCSNLSKFHCLISLSREIVLWSDKVNSSVILNLTEAFDVCDRKEPGVQIMTSEKGEPGECHICQPALKTRITTYKGTVTSQTEFVVTQKYTNNT